MKFLLGFAVICVLVTGLASKLQKNPKYKSEGCACLNGGSCVRYGLYTRPFRCACPRGYAGELCEIDTKAHCYKNNGHDYRGITSVTTHGRDCLRWDSPLLHHNMFNARRQGAMELGLGKHNFCRNPDRGNKPWCYFQNGRKVASMPCQLPRCEPEQSTDSTCGRRQHRMYKIVGGTGTSIESQPWIATLSQVSRKTKQEHFQCGGSLIHPCWVLTAAHCFPDSKFPDPKDFVVSLGKAKLGDTDEKKEQKFKVEKIIRHQQFSDETAALDNDIALVKIRSASGQCAVLTDSVQTVCLPPAGLKLKDATPCEIAGYGKEEYSNWLYSQTLKSASVQLIPQSLCQSEQYYGKLLNSNMFCAGDPTWKVDACKGDSGGPLTCEHNGQMLVYGIISWGEECAKEQRPGVYTRITAYLPWMESHMAESSDVRSVQIPK
ncbi:urokinase-type plasminogen activator isoform X1 [Ascaphus truei]|uniref:urokinase-type plasminogen activator isoform X1 n=1 Tax=Ascaphus truei TaxID=8439 RepID=UPI003F5A56A0